MADSGAPQNRSTAGPKPPRLAVSGRWLITLDPGRIRLVGAARAALAVLSAWLIMRTLVRLVTGKPQPLLVLLSILVCLFFLLMVIDLRPADRRATLWLAAAPLAASIILAGYLSPIRWLPGLILVALAFLSYYSRRYGTRPAEILLLVTAGFYAGTVLGPPLKIFPWVLAAVAVSLVLTDLWEFVLLPYNPVRFLRRGIWDFYRNVSLVVGQVAQGLAAAQVDPHWQSGLQKQVQRVHRSRRVIESLFAAVSPAPWTLPRLSRLQVEMYQAEQGLELLSEAAVQLSREAREMPVGVRQALVEALLELQSTIERVASREEQTQLLEAGRRLREQVKATEDESAGKWAFSLLHLSQAGYQIAQSVAQVRAVETARQEEPADHPPALNPSPSPGPRAQPALHPATVLGIQAALATGLALVVAYLLQLSQPGLVFWTAFVVIAGSAGESLRRMTLRVLGTIAGAALGVVLAAIVPGNVTAVALLVAASCFLAVYNLPTSYLWMIVWINVAVLLIATALGGTAPRLLGVRALNTLLGAVAAALVVTLVLPIRQRNRFIAALVKFLQAVDRYIAAYTGRPRGESSAEELAEAGVQVDTTYDQLKQALPLVAYEYNPLSRAQSRLADQETDLAALKSDLDHLEPNVVEEPAVDEKSMALISEIQEQIHGHIGALAHFLASGPKETPRPRANPDRPARQEVALEQVAAGNVDRSPLKQAVFYLSRIQATIRRIAENLGAPIK